MKIAIKKENDLIYFQKGLTDKSIKQLANAPYNYKIIDIAEEYADCQSEDFNDNLSFSVEKYNARKQGEFNNQRILVLKAELAKYKEDVEQVELFGMERTDYEEKKKRCAEIIKELRILEKEVNNNGKRVF